MPSRTSFALPPFTMTPLGRGESIRVRLSRAARAILGGGLDVLFPPACVYCFTALERPAVRPLLCRDCAGQFTEYPENRCARCGAGLPDELSPADGCPHCAGARLAFDNVIPLGLYDGLLRMAVLRMKQFHEEPLTMAVGELYADVRGDELRQPAPDCVVPIPMFWRRRIRRGTNSPDLLADAIAAHLQVKLLRPALRRRRNTLPQSKLSQAQRPGNVRRAFRLAKGYDLKGADVLLVDDILTTGTTCSAAARVLKSAGAARVRVAVVARAGVTIPRPHARANPPDRSDEEEG